ncbi:MAG: hypothetical protein CMG66_06310 [Candidatus Marinimicrobia bacterium]|nr:hypothetical protein [Candidatus Neomarinimicrobiota bacterium]|tara:strand:+ start:12001 stop:12702 length:702 start_codon:yes stop_codon:yes gene_type:complete
MRINKYLARCGVGSRRQCDEYIKNRKIKVNGNVIDNFSYSVRDSDCVQYKGKNLTFVVENYIYIVNKPRGYMCTSDDPRGRKKVIDLIPVNVRLFNIGRLDYNTTGIILFTNNGDLANSLLHPSNQVQKKYYVESKENIKNNDIENIRKGLFIPGFGKVRADITLLESKKNSFIWNIILTEGKNREIRRIFSYLSNKLKKIHRYEFAGIKLGNIKSGKYKKISYREFNKFTSI